MNIKVLQLIKIKFQETFLFISNEKKLFYNKLTSVFQETLSLSAKLGPNTLEFSAFFWVGLTKGSLPRAYSVNSSSYKRFVAWTLKKALKLKTAMSLQALFTIIYVLAKSQFDPSCFGLYSFTIPEIHISNLNLWAIYTSYVEQIIPCCVREKNSTILRI